MVYKYFKGCLSDCVWDFNCVLDKEWDIVSGDQHNARDVSTFNGFDLPICIVKSFLLPQIIFAMQALLAPPDIIQKLKVFFSRLIWKKQCCNAKAFEKAKREIKCQKWRRKKWFQRRFNPD